jgi:peptide/nickel transport system permease protein
MLQFIIRRALQSILTVLIAAALVFFAARLTPGDPAELMLGEGAPPEQIAAVRAAWGLDDPLHTQFVVYFGNLLRGDLGDSRMYNAPVLDMILDRLPATIQLSVAAMALAILLAIPLGTISALRQGSVLDNSIGTVTIGLQSFPSFFLGVQLILIFSVALRWLPSSGSDGWKYLILPAMTLAADSTALMTRVFRAEMIRILRQDYVRVAYSKGLSHSYVILRHVFRNALNPLVTVVGLRFGAFLSGAVVTETIFGWPGIGRLILSSVFARDYPMIQGIVLVGAIIFTLINFTVDIIYAFLDPRVRYS